MEGIGLSSEDPSKFFCYKNNEMASEFVPPGKESYEGTYLEGMLRHGKGCCTYANEDIYLGEWDNNKREGKGKFVWANGQFYDGC